MASYQRTVTAYNRKVRERSTPAKRRVQEDLHSPEVILGEQLASFRSRQGLTADQLAERVVQIGGPAYDRATISKIENGQRGVSLNEAFIFAAALRVAPINLFVPVKNDLKFELTPMITTTPSYARPWVRGELPLAGLEDKAFWTEVPDEQWRKRSARLVEAQQGVQKAERRLRVLRVKSRQLSADLAEIEGTVYTTGTQALNSMNPQYRRLSAKLDVSYDELAEAAVELEDARSHLQWVLGEEGRVGDAGEPAQEMPVHLMAADFNEQEADDAC
jgi:transcriptional regulator with XRE-family HTH domain